MGTTTTNLETVTDYVKFFRIVNRRAKMKIEMGKVEFRLRNTWDYDLIRDVLEHNRPMGVIFEYKRDLRWYECFFKKVQVDDSIISKQKPGFGAIARLTDQW
jgi:hypothetical protein